jgi:hypothetical protein
LVVLLAHGDVDALFTTVHVSDFGKNSDGSMLRYCTLRQVLEKEELYILLPTSLSVDDNSETFLYCFVADEAFPLKMGLKRPYPNRMLSNERRMFNYRLLHAQKSVDCAFDVLNAKFKYLRDQYAAKKKQ